MLSLVLAARYRKPWAICLGILVATLLNHALAAWLGTLVAHWLSPDMLQWIVGLSFLAVAAWTLVPDKLDDEDALPMTGRGVFVATLIAFFIAEIGDKTQVATIVLAAQHVGGFDENCFMYSDDIDLSYTIQQKGYKIIILQI